MGKNDNKYVAVAYKLYTIDDKGNRELVEETTEDKPFQFITGFGIALDGFEKKVAGLAKNEDFDFELSGDDAFGDYQEGRVLDLDKSVFSINGHFDHDNIYKDAVVPLQNEDGNHFIGRVLDITDTTVKMDLNHPLAGKKLNFKGRVVENRDATKDEIQGMINRMSGEGCGCHDCGDGCGHDGCGHGGCGHDHEHKGCGHHCH